MTNPEPTKTCEPQMSLPHTTPHHAHTTQHARIHAHKHHARTHQSPHSTHHVRTHPRTQSPLTWHARTRPPALFFPSHPPPAAAPAALSSHLFCKLQRCSPALSSRPWLPHRRIWHGGSRGRGWAVHGGTGGRGRAARRRGRSGASCAEALEVEGGRRRREEPWRGRGRERRPRSICYAD